MKLPVLANLVDELAVMKAVALALRDDNRLAYVPIVTEQKFLMDAEIALDVLWTLPVDAFTLTADGFQVNLVAQPDTGSVGCGILIEMPEMDDNSPGVRAGSPATWKVGVIGFCEPNTAFVQPDPSRGLQGGTGYTSSQLCQIAQDVLQMMYIYRLGTFQTEQSAIKAARDWTQLKPGVTAHRLTMGATVGRVVSTRSAQVVITFSGSNCTVTCSDGAATVYYTTDGSPPYKSNPVAQQYGGPFQVTSGTVVLAYSRRTGFVSGAVQGGIAP